MGSSPFWVPTGDDVPMLIKQLTDREKETRETAITRLRQIGPDALDAIPTLLLVLKDADRDIAILAAMAIIRIDPASRGTALPVLIDELSDRDVERRLEACAILEDLGPERDYKAMCSTKTRQSIL
jgi:hypothetical protein